MNWLNVFLSVYEAYNDLLKPIGAISGIFGAFFNLPVLNLVSVGYDLARLFWR